MVDPVETLKTLLAEKEKLYSSMESDIQRIESERRELASEICGVQQAIHALVRNGGSNGTSKDFAATPVLPAIGKYSAMNPTPAILDVIQAHGAPPGLLVPEIISKLKAEGYKSESKALYSMVYQISLRLVKQEKIRETKKNGKRAFARKQPF